MAVWLGEPQLEPEQPPWAGLKVGSPGVARAAEADCWSRGRQAFASFLSFSSKRAISCRKGIAPENKRVHIFLGNVPGSSPACCF